MRTTAIQTMKIFPFGNRQQQFEALIRPHMDNMYRLAFRFCLNREDAEDLVQEVVTKLYAKKTDLSEIDNLQPWLSKVIYRQFIDKKRRQDRSPINDQLEVDDGIDHAADVNLQPDQLLDKETTLNHIADAVAMLNEEQRVVIALHDVEGYSLKEIESIMDTPIGTLKSRLHRARAKIKEVIEKNL